MFSKLFSVQKIRSNKAKDIGLENTCGVYKWWCEEKLFNDFVTQLAQYGMKYNIKDILPYVEKNDGNYYCFYVGQTKSSLASRIKSQHIGKSNKKNPTIGRAIKGSTLRASINSLKNGKGLYDENYVDDILDQCLVQWKSLELDNVDTIEKEEINKFVRILNLDDFINTEKDVNFNEIRNDIKNSLKKSRTVN